MNFGAQFNDLVIMITVIVHIGIPNYVDLIEPRIVNQI